MCSTLWNWVSTDKTLLPCLVLVTCCAFHAKMVWFSSSSYSMTMLPLIWFFFFLPEKLEVMTTKVLIGAEYILASTPYEHCNCVLQLLQENNKCLRSCLFFHEHTTSKTVPWQTWKSQCHPVDLNLVQALMSCSQGRWQAAFWLPVFLCLPAQEKVLKWWIGLQAHWWLCHGKQDYSLFAEASGNVTGQKTLRCLQFLWQVGEIQYLNLIWLLLLKLVFYHLHIYFQLYDSTFSLLPAVLAI